MRSCIKGNSTNEHAKPHHCLPASRVVSEKVHWEWQNDLSRSLMDISMVVNICYYTRQGDRCNAAERRMTEETCPEDVIRIWKC